MRILIVASVIAIVLTAIVPDSTQAQPPAHLWMLHQLTYPNGAPVDNAANIHFRAWLKKVSGVPVDEFLTELSSGCGAGAVDPQIWVQCSFFGEWDQSSTWYAWGDTLYLVIIAENDPETGLTDSVQIFDIIDQPPIGESWQYYDQTSVPVPIELTSFSADIAGSDVILSWTVSSEQDNLGFHVHRGAASDGPFQRVSELIPGRGTTSEMGEYSWTDVRPGGSVLYYMLEDVSFDGATQMHGPVRVILGATSSWGSIKAEFSK